MQKIYTSTILIIGLFLCSKISAQDVFWFEDFDNGATTRWNVSGNDPTPAGIPGLTYGVNNNFDYFIINDANTPELNAPIANGLPISSQGQVVRGHHYDCSAPSNLPNPFVNTGALNNSLHITAQAGCGGLIYAGTPGYDDWNCLTISGNDFVLTQTEQFAAYNSNIDASGKCNLKLTADFFLGGSANGLEAHSTILYSIDGGATWKIVQDNLANCLHTFAGTCNDWSRRTFELPADANGEPDLRIAFRWTEDANTNNNTQDYALGASFNVDNVMLSACNVPTVDFNSQSGTNICKGQTLILNSQITTSSGVYINCFSPLSDNCTVSSYAWTFTKTSGGPPVTITYVDGTSSTDENPHVQFSGNGTFTVELTATNCAGGGVETKVDMITVVDCPPSANFSASNRLVCADPAADQDTITFTDMSSTFAAPITNWNWTFTPATVTFVNGTSASDPNPEVVFDATGVYEVALEVTSAEGVDIETKTTFVEAISCDCGGAAGGPANLYSEDFAGGPGGFILNSVEAALGTTAGNENNWTVNSTYAGGFFAATPNRGGGNYLHIQSDFACGFFGECQAVFNAGGTGLKSFTKSPVINAAGATGVSISFWMINASTGVNGRAYVYYSTDGGATWILETTYNSINAWTFQTITNAAYDNQANLRFGFLFDEGGGTGGVLDPAYCLDEISVDAAGAAALPNTWEGTASVDWGTASNWSDGTVPVSTDDVLVPNSTDLVGTFMPTISATAVAKNVCNFGTVTMIGNNTLTIDGDLLNEGVMTTDNVNAGADVIFANTASKYRGAGTMYDVDVAVTSSDLTLENDIAPRSLTIATAGTVDLATHTLRINKNLTKTAGTFIASTGQIRLLTACGTCVDGTSNADITMNANQTFGNVYVNKPAGVKVSLLSAVNHTFTAPKSLIIRQGILDANTNTLNGSGNLIMSGGELQVAKCATVVPELTGTYALTAGQVTLDGVCDQTIRVDVGGSSINYHDVEFTGTNIKTLDNGNLNINNQLFLNMPTTLGNYVNTATDTCYVYNSSTTSVVRTGGHIVGYLGRDINPSDVYTYDVGSDNGGGDTYYEPIEVTTNSISGPTNIVAKFYDTAPTPDTVINVTFSTVGGTQDTIKEVETEGYWNLSINAPLIGGNYKTSVSPSSYWSLTKPWGFAYYALLKQETEGQPWDFINGGIRVNDSTTTAFSNFSNYALAFTDSLLADVDLAIRLVKFEGEKTAQGNLLSWITEEEIDNDYFELQRSSDGINFYTIGTVDGIGNSSILQDYEYLDMQPINGWNYYRLKDVDIYGDFEYSHVVALDNRKEEVALKLMPNPATDRFTFDYIGADASADFMVQIIDVSGRRLLEKEYSLSSSRVRETINIKDLSSGVYFVQFTNGLVRTSRKLIITD